MFINNIHILFYLFAGMVGCIEGQLIGLVNKRLIDHEKIIGKGSLKKFKTEFVPYYGIMIIMFILNIILLMTCKIDFNNWYGNIKLVSYFILLPLLVSAFLVDLKAEIIPNRLVLTIFEAGLLITVIEGIFSPSGMTMALHRIVGMLVGGLIFLIITLLGGIISGKEAMGMGDVKFIGALGLFFGLKNIIVVSVLSFIIGAIGSIIVLIFKIRKPDEYIPFGPFIAISAMITMAFPGEILFTTMVLILSGRALR